MITETRAKPTGKVHRCRKCKLELTQRVHRPWVVKKLLFFLPIRKYICTKCLTGYYLLK